MTAASLERLENGALSVVHSSINIANAYVSEHIVGVTLLFSRSSGAEYLTTSLDDTVLETVVSLLSSTMHAIPKSQICGSPFPARGHLLFRRWDSNVELTASDTSTFLYAPSANRSYSVAPKTYAFDYMGCQPVHDLKTYILLTAPMHNAP